MATEETPVNQAKNAGMNEPHRFTRRDVLAGVAAVLLGPLAAVGCGAEERGGGGEEPTTSAGVSAEAGLLLSRPGAVGGGGEAPGGSYPLGLGDDRDGLVYVPSGYDEARPAPFALMLHGANSDAEGGLAPFLDLADGAGLILVAPDSRGRTWDGILGGYGPDVEFIDRALESVFTSYAVDPSRLAACGFSDGASYALSLGLTNGDLFTHAIAFSPGSASPGEEQRGSPAVFVSHGTRDGVLPIDQTSRRVVPRLEAQGYDVRYEEFDGPHEVPLDIAQEALSWFMG